MACCKNRVVWLWLLTLAVALAVVARSSFTADMSAFLPKTPSKQQQLLVDQITVGSVSRMLLMGLEGGTPQQRSAASAALAERMQASGQFSIVANGAPEAFARDRAFLFDNRYLLSPQVTPAHFSVQGLHQAIARSVDGLTSPAGLVLKQLFPRDPTGELMALLGELAAGERPEGDGVWTSKDGQRALLLAQTKAAGSNTDAQEAALHGARQAFAEVQASQPELSHVKLLLSGAPLFAVDARDTIRREASTLSLTGFLAVALLLLLVYRSPLAVGVSLLPVLSAVVIGIATVSLVFGVVHGVTVGFGTTLIGEAVDYSIYYFVQSGRATAAGESWVKRFWPTIRLGVLTSVVGFSALIFAGFPGLAQLGLYSIAGLCTAAIVTRFALPHLPLRQISLQAAVPLGQRLTAAVLQLRRGRALIWPLAATAALVIAWHSLHGGIWNRTLSGLSPVPQAAQDLDESLRRDLGQPDLRYLAVVNAADLETLLRKTEQVSAALQPLAQAGQIGGFEAPTRYLPSLALQQQRRATLPASPELEARLQQALADLPVKPATLQPFVQDVASARSGPPITPESLHGTALALTLEAMLVQRADGWSALLPLRAPPDAQGRLGEINGALLQQTLAALPALPTLPDQPAAAPTSPAEAMFIDIHAETSHLYGRYFHEALLLSLAGLAAICVLLALALKSTQRLLRVLLPLALAEVVLIGALLLTGERLTLMHLIGLLLVVAVGSNYTLFFERYALGESEESVTLVSLLVANLAAVLGFGVLGFSSVPVLHALGRTVAPGAMLALLFAASLSVSAAAPRQAAAPSST